MLPMLPLALLVVLLIRVLRPIVTIRFGPFLSLLIGNFAPNTEVYLSECEIGIHGKRVLNIYYYNQPVSNNHLKKMWDRVLPVSQLALVPDRLNRRLPGGENHVIPWEDTAGRDPYGVLAETEPHLSFTKEEEALGNEYLRSIGVADGESFICFHSRDPIFRQSILPQRDASHNDYRDARIVDYLPAAIQMAKRGYHLLRMGAAVAEGLSDTHSRIIDYANNGRTEFLDIYLSAKCKFFLGCPTGIAMVPMTFRRPTILANLIPLQYIHTWGPQDINIPKKLWLRRENRYLTFREILNSELGQALHSEQYENLEVDAIDNTTDEIAEVAIEMDDRLNGTWQTSEEDEELQRRFWSLIEPSNLTRVFRSRVGAGFLRQNQSLLD